MGTDEGWSESAPPETMPAWQDFGEWNGGVAARRAVLTEQKRLWATVARAEADRETMARWPGDCLLGAMAGKPTDRAGMFRRGPENRAGTFMRRSCRASGSAVGSSGGSGQAARARAAACTRCRALRQMARCASDLQPADAVPVCQGRVPDQVRVRTVLRMTCMCKKITQTGRRFRHACHTERRRSDEAAGGRPGMREAPRDRAVPRRCRRVTAGQAGAACRHRASAPGIRGCCRGRR